MGKVLIIAPPRPVYVVWPREISKWQDFSHLRVEILHGPDKENALKRDADIYVINPEGLDWLLGVESTKRGNRVSVTVNHKRWASFGFDTLVIDELSKFKHHTTARFKALKNVLHTFSRRWGLTGSPASNGLLDLFGQCYMLDMGNALGPYITHYREEFFFPDKYGFKWTLQPGGEERIYERIEPLMLQMGYEHLDMPELVENHIWVQLPDKVMDTYAELEKDFISAVGDNTITAMNAAAASSKLRQVANGGVFLDAEILPSGLVAKADRKWAHLHDEKTKALRELVDELQGDPLLVAYDFEHDLDRLRKEFGKDGVFACDYSMKEFSKLEERWNSGEIPLLFGHPQSIGHGLNLQGSSQNVCWHSQTWNRELEDQFVGRVWRQGNKHNRVIVHRIMAENTIDETIYMALKSKGKVEQALFDGIKRMAQERSER